jgi:hypothetical protein
MCPTMWGMGTGYHSLSKLDWNLSPPGRHPEGRVGVFGFGNHGHDVHDGHVDTVRLSHARLTDLAWPKSFANSSHPLRSLTIILGIHCVVSSLLWTPPEQHRVVY